jgi:hypothetical protein
LSKTCVERSARDFMNCGRTDEEAGGTLPCAVEGRYGNTMIDIETART